MFTIQCETLGKKAMCFPTRTIIVVVSLGVMIGVIYGRAWDKATIQSKSPNKSYLTPSFPKHVE